ncbi:MAG TPA: AraC family transcriptional regulator [Actinomycetota bacterium]
MDRDPWAPSDPLGEALYPLRMSGAYYCRSELTAPWGLTLPPMQGYMWFHAVTDGGCRLETEGADDVRLRPRDFALVPHGEGHVLRSDPDALAPPILSLPLERVSDRYEVLRHGGGGPSTTLICGAVRFHHPAARDLIALMPRVIHLDAAATLESGWLHTALELMASEARTLRPGGETVITRLSDVLVVQAIRAWIHRDPAARRGWLGALDDPQVGRAISLIHRDPSRPWTVSSLADEVSMSRSAFAARFAELVGESPIAYLTRWRMHVASEWLAEDGRTVSQVAGQLGYGSEAAFSRAFKRVIGAPPSSLAAGDAGSPTPDQGSG